MSILGLGVAVGNVIAPWLGEWVTVAIAGSIVKGIRNQFDPNKMKQVLENATAAAEEAQPETGGLFFRCQKGGWNGVRKFLGEFFQSGEVLKELQKPLEECGKPDVDILVTAFIQLAQSAQQHSEVKNYLSASLRPWMETFVESYFEQIKGICFQVAKSQYLDQLAQRVDDVKFVGIAVPGEEVEKREILAQIFVMPDVREERNRSSRSLSPLDSIGFQSIDWNSPDVIRAKLSPEQSATVKEIVRQTKKNALLEEQKEWATRDRSAPRIPAQTVINNQKKAVVLGAPGSGKTMLASYFALMLCETEQSKPSQIGLTKEDDYLPVVVRIRDWILQPKMGLLEYLRSNAEANLSCKELPTGFFEHWLDRGKALILLDGLDEVVDEAQRRKVAEQIETFLHQYQNNPAVITSRPAGYRWDFFNLDEFPHYMLESFDDKQVATFIDHWYDNRAENKAQADRLKADLQKAFARNERIKLLAKNPLLLTIIALIHRYQADLPRQRCKLYEKAVETLLTSWDLGKEIKWDKDKDTLYYLKQDDLLYLLKKLAYWIHTQGSVGETEGGTLIKKNDLIEQLRKEIQARKKCEFDEAEEEAKRFVEFIRKRTGLLNEQGRERYAFVHKTFQEYLAAEEIYSRHKRENNTEIIWSHFRDRLHDQHWREVLLLLVSKLEGLQAREAIQTVLDANSEYEQWLHRDLLFAGWCLTEDPPELTMEAEDWVGEILDRLVCLEVSDTNYVGGKIKSEVERIVHCFAETDVECKIWEKLQNQEDNIGIFKYIEFKIALMQKVEKTETDKLLSFLDNNDSMLYHFAALALGSIKDSSPIVVNKLLSLIGNRCVGILSCALALGKIGKTNSAVVGHLILLLSDSDSDIRCGAAFALGQLENTNLVVVNKLLSLLSDSNSDVRSSAASSLVQLENTNPAVERDLILLLSDKDSSVRCSAASVLGEIGNASPEARSGLLVLLDDEDSEVRCDAASALGQLKNINLAIENGLLSLLKDKNADVRCSVASALGEIGNASAEVRSGLLSLLSDKDLNVRCTAAEELGHLVNANSAVISSLLSLLNSEDFDVHYSAVAIFHQLDNIRLDVVSKILLLLLEHPDLDIRFNASIILCQLESYNSIAVDILLSSFRSHKWGPKSHAVEAIGKIGNVNPEIISTVISLLDDSEFVCMDIASVNSDVVNRLIFLLGDSDTFIRSRAASLLVNLANKSDAISSNVLQWVEKNLNHGGIGNAIDCLWSIVVE